MKLVLAISALLLATVTSGCLGCRQRDQESSASVEGPTIRVSGRILLSPAPASIPADTRLVLKLQDISLADAPSKLLASKAVDSVSAAYSASSGIPFTIEAAVPTGTPFTTNSVAVSAGLKGDGISYFTDTAYYVDLSPGTFEYRDMDITIVKYPA